MSCQETGFLQLHAEVQTSLSSQGGENAVGLFLFNDLLQNLYVQGLNIYLVCDIFIGHDGRRVGVHQDYLYSLFLQGTAGLGTCIVEFRCLSDDNRTGADYHYSFYIRILGHLSSLLSSYE